MMKDFTVAACNKVWRLLFKCFTQTTQLDKWSHQKRSTQDKIEDDNEDDKIAHTFMGKLRKDREVLKPAMWSCAIIYTLM